MKPLYITGILVLLLIVALSQWRIDWVKFDTTTLSGLVKTSITYMNPKTETLITPKETYRLGFVGDIMLDRSVRQVVNRENITYKSLFTEVEKKLQSYDMLFGNLEGPISATGTNQGSVYSFRMDPIVGSTLKELGFDVISIANNHSFDWGVYAFKETLEILTKNNIVYIGGGKNEKEAYTPYIKTLPDGTTIAMLGLSQFGSGYMRAKEKSAGIAIIDKDFITAAVEILSTQYDIVVVSMHFGEEYEPLPNKYQKTIAEAIIDAGGDVVVGHHPHVLQPLETYKNGYIAYSMGNFIFDQNFSNETMTGGILVVSIKNKEIIDAHINTTFQDELFTVHLFN